MVPLPGEFQPGLCPPGLYPVHLQSVCDAGSDVWVEEPLQVSTPNALYLINHLLCAGRTRNHRYREVVWPERKRFHWGWRQLRLPPPTQLHLASLLPPS